MRDNIVRNLAHAPRFAASIQRKIQPALNIPAGRKPAPFTKTVKDAAP